MRFAALGDRKNPAVLFFHAMGVTGESSETLWTRTQKADHETGAADNK